MTRSSTIAVFCALTAAAGGALAQYKCQIAGNVVIQDEPCRNSARRSESMPDKAPAVTAEAAPAAAISDHERRKAYLAALEKSRRSAEIREEIDHLEAQTIASQQRRDTELYHLQQRKAHANNNLAGATLEHGLAAEMQAVTSRHAADQATRNERLRHLRDELAGLK